MRLNQRRGRKRKKKTKIGPPSHFERSPLRSHIWATRCTCSPLLLPRYLPSPHVCTWETCTIPGPGNRSPASPCGALYFVYLRDYLVHLVFALLSVLACVCVCVRESNNIELIKRRMRVSTQGSQDCLWCVCTSQLLSLESFAHVPSHPRDRIAPQWLSR